MSTWTNLQDQKPGSSKQTNKTSQEQEPLGNLLLEEPCSFHIAQPSKDSLSEIDIITKVSSRSKHVEDYQTKLQVAKPLSTCLRVNTRKTVL